uniref:type II toxin-antitoxin system RelE/ParE family toxin n=1 Tax=Iodobacter sp. CM08 TaxID=3085902 RepID=UPI002981AA3B|nr:type II toxin-antitoxin system RelE/ParE family toxin [Iodobacter sp. CM08]
MADVDIGSTKCYILNMLNRIFKTDSFSKEAKKSDIADKVLCAAIKEIQLGQADDLGRGVWKKPLNKNQDRSIILAKGGKYWIFQYLFHKKDRENIDQAELKEFKKLAKIFEKITTAQIVALLEHKDLVEICHDC